MADPITTSVEVTSVTTSVEVTSATTTSTLASRFFPTFTLAAQTFAAGVASVLSATRRSRRVPISSGGVPGAVPAALPKRRRFSHAAAGGRSVTGYYNRRLRRSAFASFGVSTARALLRHGASANSAGSSYVSSLSIRRRRGSPSSAGATSSAVTRRLMGGNIIDASSVAMTDSTGNFITGLY